MRKKIVCLRVEVVSVNLAWGQFVEEWGRTQGEACFSRFPEGCSSALIWWWWWWWRTNLIINADNHQLQLRSILIFASVEQCYIFNALVILIKIMFLPLSSLTTRVRVHTTTSIFPIFNYPSHGILQNVMWFSDEIYMNKVRVECWGDLWYKLWSLHCYLHSEAQLSGETF